MALCKFWVAEPFSDVIILLLSASSREELRPFAAGGDDA